jgi:gluconate kinase
MKEKHILLLGPANSGKSLSAQVIREYLKTNSIQTIHINDADYLKIAMNLYDPYKEKSSWCPQEGFNFTDNTIMDCVTKLIFNHILPVNPKIHVIELARSANPLCQCSNYLSTWKLIPKSIQEKSTIIYLTSDSETRYKRNEKRKEAGEHFCSKEGMKLYEEDDIDDLSKFTSQKIYKISNNSTIDDLRQNLISIIKQELLLS